MNAEGWDRLVEESEREIGEAWKPTQDRDCPRTLIGTVVGYQQVPFASDYGSDDPWVCTIKDRDGKEWAVWLWQTVLMSEFERWRPMPGERVVIRYKGLSEKAPAGRSPYHRFALTVDRDTPGLPGFLTAAPELEAGSERPAEGGPPVDADVVEEGVDDEPPY